MTSRACGNVGAVAHRNRTQSFAAISPSAEVAQGYRGFAQEASWREDNRRISNGEQVNRVAGLAMAAKQSVDFRGYWQRLTRLSEFI